MAWRIQDLSPMIVRPNLWGRHRRPISLHKPLPAMHHDLLEDTTPFWMSPSFVFWTPRAPHASTPDGGGKLLKSGCRMASAASGRSG